MNPLEQPALTTDPAEWLGDAHPLAAQLGAANGLVAVHELTESLVARPVTDPDAMREFLRAYREQILTPHELPAIRKAYEQVRRNELRELIAYDRELAGATALREFAAASQRLGRYQLERLRPLRDERVVQRYLAAVEAGEAHGWHTLVYGMTLVIYSLPLRQGLLGYAQQTARGFIHAAARARGWRERDCAAVFAEFCQWLRAEGGAECLIGDEKTLS
jgi:urease accessory protein UreF